MLESDLKKCCAHSMDVRIIAAAGQVLRVATSEGSPGSLPLLVFNGFGADLDLMRGFSQEMGKHGIGIVIFDVPGIGGSSAPSFPYRLPWLASVANQVLACLGIHGPVDVVGTSWGGALAQEFAHRHSGRVRRLVLAATSPGAVSLPGGVSALVQLLDPRLLGNRDYMARIGSGLFGGNLRLSPEFLQQYGDSLRPVGCSLQLLAITGWTSALWLHKLRQPTLVMMGTDDPIVPVTNGRLLAKLIPNARLVTIADGHLFLLTSAHECTSIIADFLIDEPRPSDGGDDTRLRDPQPW